MSSSGSSLAERIVAAVAAAPGAGWFVVEAEPVAAAQEARADKPTTYVYAVGPVGGGLTKIGLAQDIEERRASIQYMSPLRLQVLWHTVGSRALERRLHTAFAQRRVHGEWFDLGSDPVSAIYQVLRGNQFSD